MRKRLVFIAAIICLIAPFLTALVLAAAAPPNYGVRRLLFSMSAVRSNVAAVWKRSGSQPGLPEAACVSSEVSACVSIVVMFIAGPVARVIATRYQTRVWSVAAVAVGLRVLPVTSAMPTLSFIQNIMWMERSVPLTTGFEIVTLIPICVAMLSAGAWDELMMVEATLSLDYAMSRVERLKATMFTVGPDLGIAASAAFLISWADFVIPRFFLDADHLTVAQFLENTQGYYGTNWGALGAAVSLSLIAPGLVIIVAALLMRARQGRIRFGS